MTHPHKQISLARNMTAARALAKSIGITQAQASRIYLQIEEKKSARRANRADKPTERKPGEFARRYRTTLAAQAIDRADFRTAKHDHSVSLNFGKHATASSDSGSIQSSQAGMSNAYCSSAFRVATSRHQFTFSETWLRDVKCRGLAIVDGLLTLSADADLSFGREFEVYSATWVRQGRGTSLTVERGWIVRYANGATYHARTALSVRQALRRQPPDAPFRAVVERALTANPTVTLDDCLAANLCLPGCRDFIARRLNGSDKPIKARTLHRIATIANDRIALVERAIVRAYLREIGSIAA